MIRFGGKALLKYTDIPEYVKIQVIYDKEKVEKMWKNEQKKKDENEYIHRTYNKDHHYTLINEATIM